MPEIPAPALRGNDPLGFLAALGVLALAEQGEIQPVRLRWEGGTAPHAVFVSDAYHGTRDLADALREVARRLLNADAAIPGCPPEFPYAEPHPIDAAKAQAIKAAGAKPTEGDPMRMSLQAARATYEDAARAELEDGNPWFARWLQAIVALGALDREGTEARICLTQFNAASGRMKFRDSIFDQACRHVAMTDGMPEDAFTGWIRVDWQWKRSSSNKRGSADVSTGWKQDPTNGYTGAKLDSRAIRGSETSTAGEPRNAGAPSPTWLAAMAFRMFPLTDDGGSIRTAGWQQPYRPKQEPAWPRGAFVWPVWRLPLGPEAVRVVLNHPSLSLVVDHGQKNRLRLAGESYLRALGVYRVFASPRLTEKRGDGPLGPAVLLWPAPR
jgi:hypothetical protein